jgi:hypothetical protein
MPYGLEALLQYSRRINSKRRKGIIEYRNNSRCVT